MFWMSWGFPTFRKDIGVRGWEEARSLCQHIFYRRIDLYAFERSAHLGKWWQEEGENRRNLGVFDKVDLGN